MRKVETHDWWPEFISLKDELSLRELATRFGVTPGALSAAMKRAGVTRQPASPGPKARPAPGADAPSAGSHDARLEAHRDLLGKVPDAEVARRAGVGARLVASFRARAGIAPFKPAPAVAVAEPSREPQAPQIDNGPVDGVSIPSDGQAWRVLFRLQDRELERVVVASSVIEAADRASRAARAEAEVLEIRWLGEVIA